MIHEPIIGKCIELLQPTKIVTEVAKATLFLTIEGTGWSTSLS